MKIILSPWTAAPLLLGFFVVGGSLYSSWQRSEQEVRQLTLHHSEEATRPAERSARSAISSQPDSLWSQEEVAVIAPVVTAPMLPIVPSGRPLITASSASHSQRATVPGRPSDNGGSDALGAPPAVVHGGFGCGLSGASGSGGGGNSAVPSVIPPAIPVGVSVPAAFGNQAALGNLSESQKATIAQIANGFTSSVQASGAAPNTPAYKQAWDTAAFQADEYFRGQFGVPAFNAMQMARTY